MNGYSVYLIENIAILIFVGLVSYFVTPWALLGLLFLNVLGLPAQ